MQYPEICLAIDNCFAYKRWTRPREWCEIIRELGLRYIEASTDNELDPLYMGDEYLEDWVREVQAAQRETGVRVANLYSGHGTYTTLGLTHWDPRVRRRLLDHWFRPLLRAAGSLDAGLGFFAHAFDDAALQDGELYRQALDLLYENLAELNRYAGEAGCRETGVEQMYTPHQPPCTISGTAGLLREVTRRSGRDFYFTEDVGHHQAKFARPSSQQIRDAFSSGQDGELWLGGASAYQIYEEARQRGYLDNSTMQAIGREMDRTSHLFSPPGDGDCYRWLSLLGQYSPIVHLQQTNGHSSAHHPFTPEENRTGIVHGVRVLHSLQESCHQPRKPGMPRPCKRIYLTLELFASTADINWNLLRRIRESVEYWRRFVPRDGMTLDQLIKKLEGENAV